MTLSSPRQIGNLTRNTTVLMHYVTFRCTRSRTLTIKFVLHFDDLIKGFTPVFSSVNLRYFYMLRVFRLYLLKKKLIWTQTSSGKFAT